MSTEPVPANKTATVVNSAIDAVFNTSATLAETALKAEFPFLGWPVIGALVDFVIKGIANKIYQYFALCVTFTIINIQTSGEVSDFNKALAALKAAQASGDPNAIAEAVKNFKAAANSLTHWDGSANPGSL